MIDRTRGTRSAHIQSQRYRTRGPAQDEDGSVILTDHNIPEHQVAFLWQARLRPQQIGRDIGRPEWQDFERFFVTSID